MAKFRLRSLLLLARRECYVYLSGCIELFFGGERLLSTRRHAIPAWMGRTKYRKFH